MAEPDTFAHGQQSIGGVDRGELDPETITGVAQEQRIANRLGRSDDQETPGVRRERHQPPGVGHLDSLRDIVRLQDAETAGQLRRRQAARQLDQRQRIPTCLGEDPVPDTLIERERHR